MLSICRCPLCWRRGLRRKAWSCSGLQWQPLVRRHRAHSAGPGWVAKQHPCLPGSGVRLYQALSGMTPGTVPWSFLSSLLPLPVPSSILLFPGAIFIISKWYLLWWHPAPISGFEYVCFYELPVNFWKTGIHLSPPPNSCAIRQFQRSHVSNKGSQSASRGSNFKPQSWARPGPKEWWKLTFTECFLMTREFWADHYLYWLG